MAMFLGPREKKASEVCLESDGKIVNKHQKIANQQEEQLGWL